MEANNNNPLAARLVVPCPFPVEPDPIQLPGSVRRKLAGAYRCKHFSRGAVNRMAILSAIQHHRNGVNTFEEILPLCIAFVHGLECMAFGAKE